MMKPNIPVPKIIGCIAFLLMVILTAHSDCVSQTFAVSSVLPPATESAQPDTLKDKLNTLIKDAASKAATLKLEVTKKLEKKSFIGQIEEITETSITLKTKNDDKKILINEYTDYKIPFSKNAKTKKFTTNDFETEEWIVALGDVDDKGHLNAKRIVKLEEEPVTPEPPIWGKIESVNGSTIQIRDRNNTPINLKTNPQSLFFLGSLESSLLDAKINQSLITQGSEIKDNSTTSRFIYFLPSIGFAKPEKQPVSTISAKIASPSGSPKKSN